jgi:nucleoside-diphosphate-sugar epimerase
MKKIAVTGGSGKVGSYVIKELISHHYEVINIDLRKPQDDLCETRIARLDSLVNVLDVLKDVDAVVHMAGINAPGVRPNEVVFSNNTISTFNVLEAAQNNGINKVVLASSESIYGFCWAPQPFSPSYFPVDEMHPLLPQECYGLSKILNEETAKMFNRRNNMDVICLRLATVATPDYYPRIMGPENEIKRIRTMWSYVDAYDAAVACRLAIESNGLGFITLNITADDTISELPNDVLLSQHYPDVTDIRADVSGFRALSSNQLAKDVLGWQPVFSWRQRLREAIK